MTTWVAEDKNKRVFLCAYFSVQNLILFFKYAYKLAVSLVFQIASFQFLFSAEFSCFVLAASIVKKEWNTNTSTYQLTNTKA